MPQPERPSLTIPAELTRRAQALIDGSEQWTAPVARDAATVILLREATGGIEVFLQRRVGTMKFAAGMHVFPGGRVEESDAGADVPWQGDPTAEPFAVSPDAGPTSAFRAITAAAARETWEEAGVALACNDTGPVTTHPGDPEADFIEWVRSAGLRISGDRFFPWQHWITPEVESRRFDTRFVVAGIPEGQEAVDRGVESENSWWISPDKAIDGLRAGSLPMLPPTAQALAELAEFATVESALAEARSRRPVPILPRPTADAAGSVTWRLVDGYTGDVIVVP